MSMLKEIKSVYNEAVNKRNDEQNRIAQERMENIRVGISKKILEAANNCDTSITIFPGETLNDVAIRKDDIPNIIIMLNKEKFNTIEFSGQIVVSGWSN